MKKILSFFRRLSSFEYPRLAVITLIVLAWSGTSFCRELDINAAARDGDLSMVKALLQNNSDVVFRRDDKGETPLHWAAVKNHEDVAEVLRQHDGRE